MRPVILAIESSCDETSASVIRNGKVLNNIIATQAYTKNTVEWSLNSLHVRINKISLLLSMKPSKCRHIENGFNCCCVHTWPWSDGFIIGRSFVCKRIVAGSEYSTH